MIMMMMESTKQNDAWGKKGNTKEGQVSNIARIGPVNVYYCDMLVEIDENLLLGCVTLRMQSSAS